MNKELHFDKVQEIDFNNVSYLLTIRAESHGLWLEAEEKYTGEIWESYFEPEQIEKITAATGNAKKFPVFAKMLISALNRSTQTVSIDLMTHREIQAQSTRRNGAGNSRTSDPRLANKRYLIMNYMGEFEKVHYPLPLEWNESPQNDRLKHTIRRLSQELNLYQQNSSQANIMKQLAFLKHENQLLKSKLKSNLHSSFQKENVSLSNQNYENKMMELSEENKQLALKYEQCKQTVRQREKQLEEVRGELAIITTELGSVRKQYNKLQKNGHQKEEYNELQQLFSEKYEILERENKELQSQIQFHHEKEKKSQIKIAHLEKQLDLMIKNKSTHSNTRYQKNPINTLNRNKQPTINRNRTPTKPIDKKSNRSINYSSDQESLKGKSSKKVNNGKQNSNRRRSSVYDSDTESSRMRKMNNYVSPYRQTRPNPKTNRSNHSQRSRSQSAERKSVKKYNNISNVYTKTTKIGKPTNREIDRKSQRNFIEGEVSENQSQQYQYTEPDQTAQQGANQEELSDNSSSSFDETTGNRVQSTIANLRNRSKQRIKKQKNQVINHRNHPVNRNKSKINTIEQRINSIAQTFRNSKQDH